MSIKTDRQIKTEATKAEYARVYDNFSLPPHDIFAECSDGTWIRRAWQCGDCFGWRRWEKIEEDPNQDILEGDRYGRW